MFFKSSLLLLLLLSVFYCESKKSQLQHYKGLKLRPDTQEASFKKQGLEVPFDDKEGLGGEPVGNIDGGNRLDGLGNEMHGFPTGMGAGAEPLGAYDQREGEGAPNFHEGGMQQGLDEGGPAGFGPPPPGFSRDGNPMGMSRDGPPIGFARDGDGDGPPQGGDLFDGRQSMEGLPQGFRQGFHQSPFDAPNDAAESVMGPQQVGMQGFLNPPAAMGESMSNSIEGIGMDKANVQGDPEVGAMVRARSQPFEQQQQQMFEQGTEGQLPQDNGASFNDGNRMNQFDENTSPEYRNFKNDILGIENLRSQQQTLMGSKRILKSSHSVGSRRHLAKAKRKPSKWEGFKPLNHHGFKPLKHH